MEKCIEKQFEGFLETPPLWINSFQELDQFHLPRVKEPLKRSIIEDIPSLSSNFVMGKRVERFFEWIIRQNSDCEILAKNVQISSNKITLGELDFLLKDLIGQQVFHIEMVYKFYVYEPSFSSEMQCWIGPNRKDTLLQKTHKLKTKQFPLLFKPETKDLLNSLGLDSEEIIQKTCFKANLFVPKEFRANQFSHINNSCITGTWLYFKDFNTVEYRNFKFFAPKKQDWPILPKHGENWVNHSEIIHQIKGFFERKKAPLIWIKKPGNKFERIFVVWW